MHCEFQHHSVLSTGGPDAQRRRSSDGWGCTSHKIVLNGRVNFLPGVSSEAFQGGKEQQDAPGRQVVVRKKEKENTSERRDQKA